MNLPDRWCPKKIVEVLSQQAAHAPDSYTYDRISELCDILELHRPVGSDGKHGDLHTPTCGCEDK